MKSTVCAVFPPLRPLTIPPIIPGAVPCRNTVYAVCFNPIFFIKQEPTETDYFIVPAFSSGLGINSRQHQQQLQELYHGDKAKTLES